MARPEIKIAELRKIVNAVLDRIEASGQKTVALEQNFYWDVPEETRYDVNAQPTEFDIRSLIDDWDCVRFALDETEEPIVDQMIELAPILRYLGDTLRKDPD